MKQCLFEFIPLLGRIGNKAAENGLFPALFSPQALGYVQQMLLLTHRAGTEVEESRRELAESLLYIPYSIDLKFNTVEIRIKK